LNPNQLYRELLKLYLNENQIILNIFIYL